MFQEIVKYKRNLQDPEISARDLPNFVFDFLREHLVTQPYPVWDIIYHITDIRCHEKNRLLEELVLNVLLTLLDLIQEGQNDKRDKLYNLLSNIFISEWGLKRLEELIIPKLYDLKENHKLLDDGKLSFDKT